jgi:hypothetical protein
MYQSVHVLCTIWFKLPVPYGTFDRRVFEWKTLKNNAI